LYDNLCVGLAGEFGVAEVLVLDFCVVADDAIVNQIYPVLLVVMGVGVA
jgi:hypothetical protein